MIRVNKEIIRAQIKVIKIVEDCILYLKSTRIMGTIYGFIVFLTVFTMRNEKNLALHETLVYMMDIAFFLFFWMVLYDRNYSMWHLPTILSFIRG